MSVPVIPDHTPSTDKQVPLRAAVRNTQFLEKEPRRGLLLELNYISIRSHSPVGRAYLCLLLFIKKFTEPLLCD